MTRTLAEVKSDIHGCFRRGEHEMEAGFPYENPLNDLQREIIAAYAAEHGTAWLGLVNLYKGEHGDADKPIIWQWDGGLVYNFGARFVIPCFDEDLYSMIVERFYAPYTGTSADYERIVKIQFRIYALNGENLIWN